MTHHTFELPSPPSVNDLWTAVKSRFVLSKKYKEWIRDANAHLLLQSRPRDPLSGEMSVDIRLPKSRKKDVDNCSKAALDLLQNAKVIGNDRDVDKVTIYRSNDQADGLCKIRIEVLD